MHPRHVAIGVVVAIASGAGCRGSTHANALDALVDVAPDATPPPDPNGCAVVFDQELYPSLHVTIDPAELTALENEFWYPLTVYQQTGAWPDPLPTTYHPLQEFRWLDLAVTNAEIRLKGNSSWRHTIELDGNVAKMQFVIAFDQIDTTGRFLGQRKIELDMPRNDTSLLHQRVGLSYMRMDLKYPAQCANNARLYINGDYYGQFTLLERLDKSFLKRNYGSADNDGDLWDEGTELENNETTSTPDRRNALFAATTMTEVTALADMDAAVTMWAGESMMPDGDGYYGGHNFFLYDHPTRGFIWLPHDLDSTMTFRPYDVDPLFWARDEQPGKHYLMVMNDPTWRAKWATALCTTAYNAYDVATLQTRIDTWAAQIESGVSPDPHYRFTHAQWQAAVQAMHDEVAQRKQFIHDWCDCYANGGTDADGDGTPWCLDVADHDPAIKLGAPETCGPDPVAGVPLDDDCDGAIDEGC